MLKSLPLFIVIRYFLERVKMLCEWVINNSYFTRIYEMNLSVILTVVW